jgi:hypothetical protein
MSTPNFPVSYLSVLTVTLYTVIISQGNKNTLFIEHSSLLDVTDKQPCLNLMMKALQSFETSETIYQST